MPQKLLLVIMKKIRKTEYDNLILNDRMKILYIHWNFEGFITSIQK